MNAEQFQALVAQTTIGKKLPDALYLHKDAFEHIPAPLAKFIGIVAKALKIEDDNWNLIKLLRKQFGLSLLNYPTFYTDSYPALHTSVTVNLSKLSHKVTQYDQSDNPPILHRKETMLHPEHESYPLFKAITEEGEQAGLYENARLIGFKNSWQRVIEKHGYELIDGRLFRASAVTQSEQEKDQIDRHKTAIVRHELSAPMKNLAKHGFLSGDHSIFDYGCGRGDDLRELEAHGLDAIGWDPNFRPEAPKMASDILNLGFVINVIEDQDERIEAIQGAWELTGQLLVVSAMLASESLLSQFKPYKDGIITSRNTFQKYYTQSELSGYLERILEETPIAISPGIFYLFKDKNLEQHFLQNRHKRHYQWKQLTTPEPSLNSYNETQTKLLFTQHAELLEDFWITCLAYGRCPANEEFEHSEEIIANIGSHKKAFNLVCNWFDSSELQQAEQMRKEDLLVYFALGLFEKRKPYTQQPNDLKRDIKAFFDSYRIAQTQAKELLFNIADTELIEAECLKANQALPASVLNFEKDHLNNDHPHSLSLHKQFVEQLSPILRIYVHAALQLYGELEDIQIIKIHLHSSKVTLLGYENFDASPAPHLLERIKIKMAEQDVDIFDYIKPERRQVLLNKIDYIDDSFDDYKKQKTFNNKLAKLLKEHPEIKSLNVVEFERFLTAKGRVIKEYQMNQI